MNRMLVLIPFLLFGAKSKILFKCHRKMREMRRRHSCARARALHLQALSGGGGCDGDDCDDVESLMVTFIYDRSWIHLNFIHRREFEPKYLSPPAATALPALAS